MTFEEFCRQYERWQRDCLAEFNERYGTLLGMRKYYRDPYPDYPDDYEPGQLVEFAEDGDAYPHGLEGIGHIRHAVTPWKDSPHYVEG